MLGEENSCLELIGRDGKHTVGMGGILCSFFFSIVFMANSRYIHSSIYNNNNNECVRLCVWAVYIDDNHDIE